MANHEKGRESEPDAQKAKTKGRRPGLAPERTLAEVEEMARKMRGA